jgi:hypothetical protein
LTLSAAISNPLINVAMNDTLADRRVGDDGQRTVRPDTVHGGNCDRKQSNSNADGRKEALPPPPFQRLSNQNGKSGDDSQSGGSGDLPPPGDSKGPGDGYNASTGHENADHLQLKFKFQPLQDAKPWSPPKPSDPRSSSQDAKPRFLPPMAGCFVGDLEDEQT